MPAQTLSLTFTTNHGEILANGKPFTIKGTTWWGAESGEALPGGLRFCSIDEIVTFVSRNSFNTIKVPLLHQHVLFNEPIPVHSFDARLNPFLLAPSGEPISYLDMLLVLAKRAAARGILVWLMAHSVEQLWFSRSISEDTVRDSWSSLSRQLCNQWNIVGVDLKNKPSAGSWGMDEPTDWNRAAERLGNHVLSGCSRWLISVEGVGQKPGAKQDPEMEFASQYPQFFDGENLVGVSLHPVELNDMKKLVYNPHVYGPSVKMMPYMQDEDFPMNMEQVWEEHFLFLTSSAEMRQAKPVVLNIGGPCTAPLDEQFMQYLVRLCARRRLSVFYYSLNPYTALGGDAPNDAEIKKVSLTERSTSNSSTGLLHPDWTRPHTEVLLMLAPLPATRLASIFGSEKRPDPPPPPSAKKAGHGHGGKQSAGGATVVEAEEVVASDSHGLLGLVFTLVVALLLFVFLRFKLQSDPNMRKDAAKYLRESMPFLLVPLGLSGEEAVAPPLQEGMVELPAEVLPKARGKNSKKGRKAGSAAADDDDDEDDDDDDVEGEGDVEQAITGASAGAPGAAAAAQEGAARSGKRSKKDKKSKKGSKGDDEGASDTLPTKGVRAIFRNPVQEEAEEERLLERRLLEERLM